jgi:hypothetical protein
MVQAMIKGALGLASSFRQLAVLCGLENEGTVAKQSVWNKVDAKAFDFLGAVLCQQLHGGLLALPQALQDLVKRVLVADSSTLSLHPSLRKHFPGASNQHAKGQASARLQVVMDLFQGVFVQFGLSGFTRNDQAAATDVIKVLRAGDLLLRDLGYFTLDSLAAIATKGAYFLSRLRYGTHLIDAQGEVIDLLGTLKQSSHQAPVHFQGFLGAKVKLPVSVVAFKLPEKIAAERRRKAREDRDRRLNHNEQYYELLGWTILITNLPNSLLAEVDLLNLYSLRWRIENIFRAWKGGLCPGNLSTHRTNHWHLSCLLLGHMLALSQLGILGYFAMGLGTQPGSPCHNSPPPMSMFKTLDILRLGSALTGSLLVDPLLEEQIHYHGRYDKRRRIPLPLTALGFLD